MTFTKQKDAASWTYITIYTVYMPAIGTYRLNILGMYMLPIMLRHYDDVIMTMLASQITSLTVVYSIVYSGVNQRKHQSSASLAFVREIHRGPVNFPHKWPVTRKMFPFDDVIMGLYPAHSGPSLDELSCNRPEADFISDTVTYKEQFIVANTPIW